MEQDLFAIRVFKEEERKKIATILGVIFGFGERSFYDPPWGRGILVSVSHFWERKKWGKINATEN